MYILRVEWCKMVLMDKGSGRLLALEGLRGVAAIVVVIFHALLIFYEYMIFGPSATSVQHMPLEDNLFASPLRIFFAGTFAVAIFFVLSGVCVVDWVSFEGQKNHITKTCSEAIFTTDDTRPCLNYAGLAVDNLRAIP